MIAQQTRPIVIAEKPPAPYSKSMGGEGMENIVHIRQMATGTWVAERKGGLEQGIGPTEIDALTQLIRREQNQ